MADNTLARLHAWDTSYGSTQAAAGTASGSTKRIQDLLDANPYRNVSYNVSPWQKLLSALGFRTQADAWKENMTIQANEYDAAILQKQADEQYNSPTEQAQRMQAAGLNPNLNGGQSIDSGSAAPMGEDPSTPMQSTGDGDVIFNAANLIMGSFSSAFSMAKDFASLRNMHLTNEAGELQNGQRVVEIAKWITENTLKTQQGFPDLESFRVYKQKLSQDMYNEHSRFIPRRFRHQFKRNLDTFYSSLNYAADSYSKQKDLNQGMKDVGMQIFSKYFGGSDLDAWKPTLDALVKLSDLSQEVGLKASNSQNQRIVTENDYTNKVFENSNPVAEANSKNEQNLLGAQSSKFEREVKSILADYVHDLKRKADKGDIFARCMLLNFSMGDILKNGLSQVSGIASKLL